MVEYPDLEEILALNPHIDKEEIKKCIETLYKLRSSKVSGNRYNLALPFTRRHIFVDQDSSVDPRTVDLGRSR